LENATDLFPYSEMIRELVNQSMTIVRRIARKLNCAVVLLQHVSETSRTTGENKSGSTAWHNKARYRFSLAIPSEQIEGTKIIIEDDTKRVVTFHKNQYGKRPEALVLDNETGYFATPGGSIVPVSAYQREIKEEETFLQLLDQAAERGMYYSPQPCASGVIQAFMGTPEGKAIGKRNLKAAMERLKKKKLIKIGLRPDRPPSRSNDVVLRDTTKRYIVEDADAGPDEDIDQDASDTSGAKRFLETELGSSPKVASEVIAAAKVRGFNKAAILRARMQLGIREYREGTPSVLMWCTTDAPTLEEQHRGEDQ
jgi:hypothetical protein